MRTPSEIADAARAYLVRERMLIRTNRQDVDDVNLSLLKTLFGAGSIAFGALLVLSFFHTDYVTLHYVPVLLALLICLAVLQHMRRHINATVIYIAGFLILDCWLAFSSGYLWPHELSVMVLAVLFLFAVTLLESTSLVTTFEIILIITYLIVTIGGKDPDYFSVEALNCCLFALLGSVVGLRMRTIRLENFDLKREALEKERTDFLTGLGSRRLLFDTMAKVEQGEDARYFGVMMVDVDDFKLYNDTYGHQEGDDCLRALGHTFTTIAETGIASFYRYGGEEFVGLLYSQNSGAMRAACDTLNASVRSLAIPHANERGYVSVSIGLAMRPSGYDAPIEGFERLLHEADLALYMAKSTGKDKTVCYKPEFEESAGEVEPSYR